MTFLLTLLSSFVSTSYSSSLYSSSISMSVAMVVVDGAGSTRDAWKIGYIHDPLGSFNRKLTSLIFSSISNSLIFLKSNLLLGRFVFMCLLSK